MSYKVLITTSGIGSRLGEFTKYTNKSLVRIGKKPVLAHIIEKYDETIPLVITIGYYGSHVKEFCTLAYPKRDIIFVEVDNYQGEGSSLAYSMLQAKKHLQCPFIFHAGDTLIEDEVNQPSKCNYVAGYKSTDSSQYTSFTVQGDKITGFLPKGSSEFDYIHIGLVSINSYQLFWDELQKLYDTEPNNSGNCDVDALQAMIKKGTVLNYYSVKKWYDVGNMTSLEHTRQTFPDQFENLDKVDESLFIIGNSVIKFFHDSKSIFGRVNRAKYLQGLVPEITDSTTNFYKYNFCGGLILSDNLTLPMFSEFLDWSKKNLFVAPKEISADEQIHFNKVCLKFYKEKTLKRLSEFYDKYKFNDTEDIINGVSVPKLSDLLDKIDFENWLANGKASRFHGDFHCNNVIKTDSGFMLIDWRQDFGGMYEFGDVYYDLAKLYHGLIVNHQIIQKDLFEIKSTDSQVHCDILRSQILVSTEKEFLKFLKKENYDIKKVQTLTALIYLNIATLHHNPYDKFLYYFGKLMLHEVLN